MLVKNVDVVNKLVFLVVDMMVKDGGVVIYSINQYKFGVVGVKVVVVILKGKVKLEIIVIEYICYGELVLNFKQVNKLGFKVLKVFEKVVEDYGEVFK